PLNSVVPPAVAARWIEQLLALKEITPDAAAAVAPLGALTGDATRDVAEAVRERALHALAAAGCEGEVVAALRDIVPVDRAGASRIFGESLPEGLRVDAASVR
ncbi:MAG: molecular chaperone DnaK, partial [Acidobacteriota bacterium]